MSRFLRQRSVYTVLLVLAASVNAAGYLFSLWHDETVYDEAVHLFTSFAVIAAVGRFLISAQGVDPSPRLAAALVGLVLVLGIAWEVFEWLIGIIGGRQDTLMDLGMDLLGGCLAAVLVNSVFGDHRGG